MVMQSNFVCATDFYKGNHWKQYPIGMNQIRSYCEARFGAQYDEVVYEGLRPILKDHFEGQVVTKEKIQEGEHVMNAMGGFPEYFNRPMWEHILNKYGGHLPLIIDSLEEGTVVRPGTPLFKMQNIDDGSGLLAPLVNHSETLLTHLWSATTVATISRHIKKQLLQFAIDTGTPELVPYMLHDFGFRGVSSYGTAVHSGMGHLTNFAGTDTTEAVRGINYYYPGSTMHGSSVWATEHSVATSFGPGAGERAYLKHQLKYAPDNAIISIVCDSYDTFNFAATVAGDPELRALIIARKGRVVFRPDSGDPKSVVSRLLDILSTVFGFYINDKSYKVLSHNVGVLQGDGMDVDSIPALYQTIIDNKWSSDNLVVGSGGGLLQKWNRDTLRFAIKAYYGEINGKGFDIFKNPATATGSDTKTSRKGDFKVQEFGNLRHTIIMASEPGFASYADSFKRMYKLGEIKCTRTFDDVRAKAAL